MNDPDDKTPNIPRAMLLTSGIVFLLLGVLCSHAIYDRIMPLPSALGVYQDLRNQSILSSRTLLFGIGAAYSLIWILTGTIAKLKAFSRKPGFANGTILLITLSFFALAPELLLRPLALPSTTIFMPDENLDWKLRPGAEDFWGDSHVRINSKGNIGPEIDYAKPADSFRVLFLGDSVTFGFGIKDYRDTYVAQFETLLGQIRPDVKIETINAGVGGYSPWQYFIVLAQEGSKYDPDLVVVSFVLNDVTEKMGLTRFGGSGSSFQLVNTVNSRLQSFLSKSAVFRFSRVMFGMIKYGKNMRVGAQKKELLDVEFMVKEPDDPKVRLAWEITLESLAKIYKNCRENGTDVLLVVFPFTFQFDHPEGLDGPQRIVAQHASEHDVPVLDLLPILADKLTADGLSPDAFFIDVDHPTPAGSRFIAETLVEVVSQRTPLTRNLSASDQPDSPISR